MSHKTLVEFAKSFYGDVIPEYGSREFAEYLLSSVKFARYVCGKDVIITTVSEKESGTPFVILSESVPVISFPVTVFDRAYAIAMNEEFEDVDDADFAHALVAIFDGHLLHEVFHVIHTVESLGLATYLITSVGKRLRMQKYRKLFAFAFNVVEDVYIDTKLMEHAAYGEVRRALLEMMFPTDLAKGTFDRLLSGKKPTLEDITKAAVFYKRPSVRDHEVYTRLPKITGPLEQAAKLASKRGSKRKMQQRRAELAASLVDAILEYVDETDAVSAGSSKYADDDSIDKIEAGKNEAGTVIHIEKLSKQATEIANTISRQARSERGRLEMKAREGRLQKMAVECVWKSLPRHVFSALTPSPEFAGLGKLLRVTRFVKEDLGLPEKRGRMDPVLLPRTRVDGRVFRQVEEKQEPTSPEVIFILDASGSTGPLYHHELSAAWGAFNALKTARIPVAVYAHTAYHEDKTHHGIVKPTIYTIAKWRLDGTTYDNNLRFQRAAVIYKQENVDGHAIDGILRSLPAPRGQRIVFILSDGEPSAPGYRGPKAVDHTKMVVERYRDNGNIIIAVSLVPYVGPANSHIYGREFNVDASANLNARIRSIVLSYTTSH